MKKNAKFRGATPETGMAYCISHGLNGLWTRHFKNIPETASRLGNKRYLENYTSKVAYRRIGPLG